MTNLCICLRSLTRTQIFKKYSLACVVFFNCTGLSGTFGPRLTPYPKITRFPKRVSKTSRLPPSHPPFSCLCPSMLPLPLLPSHPLQNLPDFIPTHSVKYHLIELLRSLLKFSPALLQPITSPPLRTRHLCCDGREGEFMLS